MHNSCWLFNSHMTIHILFKMLNRVDSIELLEKLNRRLLFPDNSVCVFVLPCYQNRPESQNW